MCCLVTDGATQTIHFHEVALMLLSRLAVAVFCSCFVCSLLPEAVYQVYTVESPAVHISCYMHKRCHSVHRTSTTTFSTKCVHCNRKYTPFKYVACWALSTVGTRLYMCHWLCAREPLLCPEGIDT